MKMNLHLYGLVIIIMIMMLTPIYSCHTSSLAKAPENIKIVGIVGTNDLELKDAGNNDAKTFKVKAGRKINWLLNTPNVRSIDSIYKKTTTTSDPLFTTGPSRKGNSQNWEATIDPNAKEGQFVDYNIDWTDTNGQHHTFDPRIQVKS